MPALLDFRRPGPGWLCRALVLLVGTAACVCGQSPRPESPASPQVTYTVGVLDDNPPFSFRDADGEIRGYAVDLLAAVERHAGLALVRRVGPTAEINRAFERGELDMLQSYVPNADRLGFADFSTPYLRMNGVIFARRGDSHIRSLQDLRGRKVLVHRGSVGARLLEEHGLKDSIVEVSSVEEGFQKLEAGLGDATLASRVTGMTLVERAGLHNVAPVGQPIPGYLVNYSFAMRKGLDPLHASVDEALALLDRPDASGVSPKQQIYDRWFGFIDPRFSTTQIAVAVSAGLAVALIIALWAMMHQRRLRHQLAAQARELQASTARYRTVFESTLHGLMVFERDERPDSPWLLVQLNAEARRILGAPARSPATFDLAYPAEASLGVRLAAAIGSAAPQPFEHDRSRADSVAWVDIAVSRLGEHSRLVALRDITTEKVAAERLRLTEAQLRQNQKLEAIGTLASGIAHDFNNILTAITGNLELAKMDVPAGHPIAPAITEIAAAADRARFLVRQILAFSRRVESRREVVSVTPMVKETLRFMSATAPRSVTLRHRVEQRSPSIEIDPSQLHQVLMNLCTNAVQALQGRNGEIEITEQAVSIGPGPSAYPSHLAPGEYLLLSVRDSGVGMPPEVLQRVFEPFFTTKAAGEGTGLGLAVVHGIVSATGGAIAVTSSPGAGTTFRLYFPATSRPQQAPSPTESIAPPGAGESILLIDDEASITQAARTMLVRLGYAVTACTRPLEALSEFEQRPQAFDVVVTDLTMPQMNGIELAARLRALRAETPIVLISGFVSDRDVAHARTEGITQIVDKPLTLASLAGAVAEALAQARTRAS